MQGALLLILSWLCTRAQSHNQSSPCIGTYEELVDSVRSRTINIDNLTDGFYPPNRQTTTVADIYYYISDDQNGDAPTKFKYKFRWSSSSILNLIRPELLRDASLFLYPHSEIAEMHIVIDPICSELQSRHGDILADWESACLEKVSTVDSVILLNKLTTHLKSYVLDTKFNDKKRGYSCYFAKTRECCVIGQEATYQLFRIQVSVVLWTLVVLSVIVGIPYILFVRLKALKLQEHSNRHQVWASCILLTFIVLSITFRFWYISYDRYYEASATADFKVNYVLVVVMLPFSFVLCSIVACFCDTICGHFGCFDCYNNCKLELSSCICPCKKPWIARILTYMIIGLVFNALHLLILCGYAIMLAIVASPFHAMPVLLLYLSCIYVFVITVSENMKKSICISLTIVVPTNAILSILIIWSYFTMVAMIGEYSKDEGLWSVVGGFLPVLINILLGYFIREIVNLLSPKVKID